MSSQPAPSPPATVPELEPLSEGEFEELFERVFGQHPREQAPAQPSPPPQEPRPVQPVDQSE